MEKKYFFLFILISQFSFSQIEPNIEIEKLLIGKWAGIDNNGNSNVMILEEGNYVTFSTKNKTYGREFEANGGNFIYKYSVDSSKNPVQIDFVIFRKETNKEEEHFKSIIRLVDKNTIEMRHHHKDKTKYPNKFAGKKDDNTIILKRVQS
jgi:meiotically up-regulated gene 157 (Mug157) protein